jgi:hypothetical protein
MFTEYITNMATQFFVFNTTDHKMLLKVHKPHTIEWDIVPLGTYSLKLFNDATHDVKYKIKHDGDIIAYIWINHDGKITSVKNCSKKYSVETPIADECNVHNDDGSYNNCRPCYVTQPPVMYIVESHHHDHHDHHHDHHRHH